MPLGNVDRPVVPSIPHLIRNTINSCRRPTNPLHVGLWPRVNQCEAELVQMTAQLMSKPKAGIDSPQQEPSQSMMNGNGNHQVMNGNGNHSLPPQQQQQKESFVCNGNGNHHHHHRHANPSSSPAGQHIPVGTVTSGGTESILLAIKAHWIHYGKQRNIQHPELICAPTAHASVDKACVLFGIRKVVVPCDVNFALDISKIDITSNTILIYASAPCYPQGVMDPIYELSELAFRYGIGLHVDACLGGFILPFANTVRERYDFGSCRGITSMSVDTHKFAYATKGTSIVLYRDSALRHAQYFSFAKWTGGLYCTPTLAGSRPGALSVCAWAAMVSIGKRGYQQRVETILNASRQICNGILKRNKDLQLLTKQEPPLMIVCFTSKNKHLDIYQMGNLLQKQFGWTCHALQNPPCLHLCLTLNTAPRAKDFLQDLDATIERMKKEQESASSSSGSSSSSTVYGTAARLPEGPVNELLKVYTDATWKA